MKAKHLIILILLILLADQALKFYIKLNYVNGEEHILISNWFRLHFIENEGMAWGWRFGGAWGKVFLTLFRLGAVCYGVIVLGNFIRKGYHKWFIACSGMIFAGAAGNLLDSLFYGLIFSASEPFTLNKAVLFPKSGGYAGLLHGKVVDMLYFPLVSFKIPASSPMWGGMQVDFFEPVFNIADASISVGVFSILIFQNFFFKNEHVETPTSAHGPEDVSMVELDPIGDERR